MLDFASKLLSSSTNLLMLDAPRRTAYGVLIGYLLHIVVRIINWFEIETPEFFIYEFIVVGLVVMHIRTIFELGVKRRIYNEKIEEQFAVISEAEKRGLGKAHIKLKLLEVCQNALKEAKLNEDTKRRMAELEDLSEDD